MTRKTNEREKMLAQFCSGFWAVFYRSDADGEDRRAERQCSTCIFVQTFSRVTSSCHSKHWSVFYKGDATSRVTSAHSQWQEPASGGRDVTEVQRLEVFIATFSLKTQGGRSQETRGFQLVESCNQNSFSSRSRSRDPNCFQTTQIYTTKIQIPAVFLSCLEKINNWIELCVL